MSGDHGITRPGRAERAALTVTSFLLAAGTWAGWFGWDTLRTVDPVTGSSTGPYAIWQGVGAALTLVAIMIVFVRRLALVDVVLAVSCGFSAGFACSGALDPEADGLYLVGAGMLLVVMLCATTLVGWVTRVVLDRRHRPRDEPGPSL